METVMYTQNTAKINGREINHYLMDTPIGQINIIQYEKPSLEIETELIYNNYEKAEKRFSTICKQMLNGKR